MMHGQKNIKKKIVCVSHFFCACYMCRVSRP